MGLTMVLTIPFHDFALEARERFVGETVFVSGIHGRTLVTVSNGTTEGYVLRAWSEEPVQSVRSKLELGGLKVREGQWSDSQGDESTLSGGVHVFAIAYKSEKGIPGLWLDAGFDFKSEAEVLRNFFDELRDNAEIVAVSYEDFVRSADARVLVLTPSELIDFALDARRNDNAVH